MDGIKQWIEAEGSGHWFFVAFPVVLLCLFIWFKGRRVRFLIPSLLISIVIINPLFYKYWDELELYAYWRILWVVPVVPVVAGLVPSITERIQRGWIKAIVAAAGVGLVIVGGTFLYNGAGGSFVEAANAVKEPDYVVQIADRLLEIDDSPRVVFQNPIGTYIRQYTGEIDQLYGRNIDGYILGTSSEARTVNSALNDLGADLTPVATLMANDDYEYLVVDSNGREEQLSTAGFELIDIVAGYGIYKAHGAKTLLKQRNELGQVVSVTTIDENGKPVNGENGYATVEWSYDDNGLITREFRTDINGIGVADGNGRAGYERVYDDLSHILLERYIDPDGKAIANSVGYAEYRREYKGSDLISESYYDESGMPVNRIDTGYASIRMIYDNNHNRLSETYYNITDEVVNSLAGYAKVIRAYDQKRMISETYFDTQNQPVTIVAGYSSKHRTYDENGNMTSESYFDESGLAVNNINGYSKVEYEYDDEKNVILERFKDASGNSVMTGSGYAEVHRVFNERRQVVTEEYYGTDGKPYEQAAGYTAIEQEWADDALLSRFYLNTEGQLINRTDGYAKAVWEQGDTCTDVHFYDVNDLEVDIGSRNLARDVKVNADGWSDWLMPNYNTVNSCHNIGYTNLGPKAEGDVYTCTIEIEFKDVTATDGQAFRFWTQGAQDGKWNSGNVWNGNLVNLFEAPEDGMYRYTATVAVSGAMVDVNTFNIGFRCDYWASGMYRVRYVKVEKGETNTEWSPGL